MSETVKEIEITGSLNEDNWYAKCIGQKFKVIDPAWWTTFTAPDDCYYVEHSENDEDTACYVLFSDCKVTKSVAQSDPETTASPSETAADKGILTEEELNKYLRYSKQDFGLSQIIANKAIASHRNLLSANAELSFKCAKIPALEADNKLLEETCEELEDKLSKQNEEICRLQDEISKLRGENNHE